MTRQVMSYRKGNGGFVTDVPQWELEPGRAPIVPACYRQLSRQLWMTNPEYVQHPEVSTTSLSFVDPLVRQPVTRQFMNPRDDFVLYREEMAKPGNKAMVRKGGGSMKKTL